MYRFLTFFLSITVFMAVALTSCDDEQESPESYNAPGLSTSPKHMGDWFEQLTAIVRLTETTGAEASRIFAYASIAFYEGYVQSDPTMRTLEGQIPGLDGLPRATDDETFNYGIIAEAAMSRVLAHGFADAGEFTLNVIRSTYQNHESRYADIGIEEPIVERSRVLGHELGDFIIAWMDADGIDAVLDCQAELAEGPNVWQPTPPGMLDAEFPCWGELRPFTFPKEQTGMICATFFPTVVSQNPESDYFEQVNDLLNTTAALTEDQEAIARHWQDGVGTFTAPGHYMSLFRQLIAQHSLNGRQTATMFAQLCIAMADVYIVMYHDKYEFSRPRPITFIREHVNAGWSPVITTPPTPEYPCVRAGLAYAAGQVFTNIYGNKAFTDDSQYLFGLAPRSYESFNDLANEAVLAHVYAGTNYRETVLAAEYTARCISQRSNELFLNQ